jgi:hypothetical protein
LYPSFPYIAIRSHRIKQAATTVFIFIKLSTRQRLNVEKSILLEEKKETNQFYEYNT